MDVGLLSFYLQPILLSPRVSQFVLYDVEQQKLQSEQTCNVRAASLRPCLYSDRQNTVALIVHVR